MCKSLRVPCALVTESPELGLLLEPCKLARLQAVLKGLHDSGNVQLQGSGETEQVSCEQCLETRERITRLGLELEFHALATRDWSPFSPQISFRCSGIRASRVEH